MALVSYFLALSKAAGATDPGCPPAPRPQALFSSEGHPGRHGVGLQRLHLVIEGDGGLLCSPQPTVSFTPLTGRQGYVPIIQTRKLRFRKAEQPCSHLQGDVGAGLGSGLGWLLSTPCLTLGSYLGLWVLQFHPLYNDGGGHIPTSWRA